MEYFEENKNEEFVSFFQEGQYFMSLWAAHLLLEFGKPKEELISKTLEIIIDYSDNPLAIEVSNEEKAWLIANISKYR